MDRDELMKKILIVGFGFRSSAGFESLANALSKVYQNQNITAFAAPADKIRHSHLIELARYHELPLYGVAKTRLMAVDTPTKSPVILQKRQTGSIAEAAALGLFIGPATLLCNRQISDDGLSVCALAEGVSI